MRLDMFFQFGGGLEFLVAGLASVDLASDKLFAVLLHMQTQLTLQDKLISTLATDQVLTPHGRDNRERKRGKGLTRGRGDTCMSVMKL